MLVQFLVYKSIVLPPVLFSLRSMLSPHTKERREQQKSDCFALGLLRKGRWVVNYCAHAMISLVAYILAPTFSSVHLSACMQVLTLRSISTCRRMHLSLSLSMCEQNLLSIRANHSPIAWRLSMENTEARRTSSSLDTGVIGAKTICLILADEIFPPKFSTHS